MPTRIRWTPERLREAEELVRQCGGDIFKAAQEASGLWGRAVTRSQIHCALYSHNRGRKREPQPVGFQSATTKPDPELLAWQRTISKYRQRTAPAAAPAAPGRGKIVRGAVIPDVHIPYSHRTAWSTALGVVKEWAPHRVEIIGDFLDMESLSRHPKSRPDIAKVAAEFYAGNVALDALQNAAPNAEYAFIEGNHEDRANAYANEHGTLDGLLSVSEQLFIRPRADGYHRASEGKLRGMRWVPLREQPWVQPFANFMHGVGYTAKHFTDRIAAEHPGVVTISGHMHNFQRTAGKTGGVAQCSGFLGDERAPVFYYANKGGAKKTGWELGLMLYEAVGQAVTLTPVPIVNGRALFSGRTVVARAA